MAAWAVVRDIEAGTCPHPQDDARSLKAALAAMGSDHAPAAAEGGEALVRLPRAACRPEDPADGRLPLRKLLKRARKIGERGAICMGCAACANTPERFGCWGTLTFPFDAGTIRWMLQTWRRGAAGTGKARLHHWISEETVATVDGPSPRSIVGVPHWDAGLLTVMFQLPGKPDINLNAGRLLLALLCRQRLDMRGITEFLADFAAVEWETLKELGRAAHLRQRARRRGETSDPADEPPADILIPFLHQPERDDPHAVREFKTFLFTCYCALHLGAEMVLMPVGGD